MPSSRRPACGGLVYSTEGGRMCPACRRPLAGCVCAAGAPPAADAPDGSAVRVGRVRQGRAGKTVTVVQGVPLAGAALADLGRRLRAACGAGGTLRPGALEIQGDHVERVVAWLAQQHPGWTVKRSGG